MKIRDNKFYVVCLGSEKEIVESRKEAIQTLKTEITKLNEDANIEALNPEIIEVDTSGEKWSLKGISWNLIALELMRGKSK